MTTFLVRGTAALAQPHAGDLTQTLAFTTVACANVSHLPYGSPEAALAAEGRDPPGSGMRRPVSVNAVARSLGLPFETVRLRIHRREALGLCERTPAGVVVPARAVSGPVVTQSWQGAHASLCDCLGRLQSAGVDLEALARLIDDTPVATAGPPPPMLVLRIALDSVLRMLERFGIAFGSLSRGYLFCSILSANTRHFDEPPYPTFAYAYNDTPPPDDQRRPVSIRGMARELGLPVETTRRNVERLAADGWLLQSASGLTIPAELLTSPKLSELGAAVNLNTTRMLVELRRVGLRFDALT